MSQATIRKYIPCPKWDGKQWLPIDHCGPYDHEKRRYAEMPWPDGFDPSTLPTPRFRLGDTVRVRWDGGIRAGKIESICLRGGGQYDGSIDEAIAGYFRSAPSYVIRLNGHGRYVEEAWIVVP